MSKVINEVLSSDDTIDLVQKMQEQGPRLFCRFDKNDPVYVNELNFLSDDQLIEQLESSEKTVPGGLEEIDENVGHEEEDAHVEEMMEGMDDHHETDEKKPASGEKSLSKMREGSGAGGSIKKERSIQKDGSKKDASKSRQGDDEASLEKIKSIKSGIQNGGDGSKSQIHGIEEQSREGEEDRSEIIGEGGINAESEYMTNHLKVSVKKEFGTVLQEIFDQVFLELIKDCTNEVTSLCQKPTTKRPDSKLQLLSHLSRTKTINSSRVNKEPVSPKASNIK